jgi:hypothetical protein
VRDADGTLAFHALAPSTTDEVTEVAVRTAKRLQKVSRPCRRGPRTSAR